MPLHSPSNMPNMSIITVRDNDLRRAAGEGIDAFIGLIADACRHILGDEPLTAESMDRLNADQHTLLAYVTLRDELMDGGFCQLIQNGLGPYILHNPLARALKQWGVEGLPALLHNARRIYDAHQEELERERTDDEFMAMYEEFDVFDPLEEEFLDHEEEWTEAVAQYVDQHLERFVQVVFDGEILSDMNEC